MVAVSNGVESTKKTTREAIANVNGALAGYRTSLLTSAAAVAAMPVLSDCYSMVIINHIITIITITNHHPPTITNHHHHQSSLSPSSSIPAAHCHHHALPPSTHQYCQQ